MAEWYTAIASQDPPSKRKLAIAAAGGVVLVALIGAVWSNATSGGGEAVIAAPGSEVGPTVAPPPSSLIVQVVGAVESPGVYELPIGARVLDAVTMAGGLTARADAASLNLARIVNDGEQLIVGELGSASKHVAATSNGRININLATEADFESLPRIGPTLAERIVAFRDTNGSFASIDALLDVPGIGQLTLDGMRDHLTL